MSARSSGGRAGISRSGTEYPDTPDGRYFVVRGRLWRKSNPELSPSLRDELVNELMSARRDVRKFKRDPQSLSEARERVDAAKVALGERGPVWWTDGAPDFNRHLAANTPYADWYAHHTRWNKN
ncbi:hypothetical protein [Pararhizobium arenae]|uniref:hypothetical protein n=1 Tax=Pararhizobium arenae TaxID=1856850 RepID=UPI00094B5350|nr:hypothetical protein [Pararhizobium arenae]